MKNKEHLDQKLMAWSKQSTLSDKNEEKLIQKIIAKMSSNSNHLLELNLHVATKKLYFTRGLLCAAIILLTINFIWGINQSDHFDAIQTSVGHQKENHQRPSIQEIKEIASEIDLVFPEGIQWLSYENGKLNIQAGKTLYAGKRADDAQKIVLTLQVMKREGGRWFEIKRHDIISRLGEPIKMTDNDRKSFWTHQLDGQHVSISTRYLIKINNLNFNINEDIVQQFNRTMVVSSFTSQGIEYTVLQTVQKI